MARYIDADELLHNLLDDLLYKASVKRVLIQASEADVVEVKHGEWEKVRVVSEEYGFGQIYYQHKDCKISPTELYESPYEHCPRCGAKMDGGKTE